MLQPSPGSSPDRQLVPVSDIKVISGDASQAAQQAAAYCHDLEDALKKAEYSRFEGIARVLTELAHARLAERASTHRIQNPMAVVDRLIKLLEKNAQLQHADQKTKLALARALHVYLDLMIIENYEQPDAKKLRISEDVKKFYLKIIDDFRDLISKQAFDIRYELDCCYGNIRALEDNHSLLSDLKNLLLAIATTNIESLLSITSELHGRMSKSWQVNVLLIRRLTPLAQSSPKVLTMLQELMSSLRKTDSFHVVYAMQEALYNVVRYSEGEERILLQQQALGFGKSKKEERSALTLQYFEGVHADRSRLGGSAVFKSNDVRYRLVRALTDLSFHPGESKGVALQMLTRLSVDEPRRLSLSRQWITEAFAMAVKENPEFKPIQAMQAIQAVKDQQIIEQKTLGKVEAELKIEQKKIDEDKQSATAKPGSEQQLNIERRRQELQIKQKDLQAAMDEHHSCEEKLKHDSESLDKLQREHSDHALALSLWADELANQAKKEAEIDHPEIIERSSGEAEEAKLIWPVYSLPARYPLDYATVIEDLSEAGAFAEELTKSDYCPIFKQLPLYDAVELIGRQESHGRNERIGDGAARQRYSQGQRRVDTRGQPIIKIVPDFRTREVVTERIHPKVAGRYYELGRDELKKQTIADKSYNRWAECWRGALAIMPADHKDGAAWKALSKEINDFLKENSQRLLIEIIQTGQLVALQWLAAEISLDFRAQDEQGNSFLMRALQHRQPAVAGWLLAQADGKLLISLWNEKGEWPLHIGAKHGEVELLELLLEEKGDINKANIKGETALHYAAWYNQVAAVQWLLGRGASLSVKDQNGNTALHAAAQAGAKETLILLLQSGLSHQIRNKAGQTPRQLAEEYKQIAVIEQHDLVIAELTAKEEAALRKSDSTAFAFMFLQMKQFVQNQQEQIEGLQTKIITQQQEIKKLQTGMAERQQEIQGLREQDIKTLRVSVTANQQEMQTLRDQEVKPLKTEIAERKQEIKDLREQQTSMLQAEATARQQEIKALHDREIAPLKTKVDEQKQEVQDLRENQANALQEEVVARQQEIQNCREQELRPFQLRVVASQQEIQSLREQEIRPLQAGMVERQQEIQGLRDQEIKTLRLEVTASQQEIQRFREQEIKKLNRWESSLFSSNREKILINTFQQEEEKLRLELVTACEKGDIKAVQLAIKNGALPFCPGLDEKQKQPLGAAIWGMNPEVVDYLLEQMGGTASMTWEECVRHNQHHYYSAYLKIKRVFMFDEFKPQTFKDWFTAIEKMESSPFISALHVEKCNEGSQNKAFASFEKLKQYVSYWANLGSGGSTVIVANNPQERSKIAAEWKQTVNSIKLLNSGGGLFGNSSYVPEPFLFNPTNPEEYITRANAGFLAYKTQIKSAIEAAVSRASQSVSNSSSVTSVRVS